MSTLKIKPTPATNVNSETQPTAPPVGTVLARGGIPAHADTTADHETVIPWASEPKPVTHTPMRLKGK